MAKKIVTLILAITLTLSVSACSGKDDTNTPADSGEVQTEEEPEASGEETQDSQEESTKEEAQEDENADSAGGDTAQAGDVDALAAAQENMLSVTSLEGQLYMEMDMEISANGESQSMETVTTTDMVCFNDPRKMKIDMNMSMKGLGNTQQSVYGEVTEDGTAVLYVYDGTNWEKQVAGTVDLEQYDASSSMLSFIDDGSEYTLAGMEEVDGVNAYKYSRVKSGEEAKEAVLSSGSLDSYLELGLDVNQLESSLEDLGEIVEYIWIDEANLYPIKYETDMTEVMDAMLSGMLAGMGDQAEGLSMNISKMKMSMTCFNFNNATDFTIPEEAKQD